MNELAARIRTAQRHELQAGGERSVRRRPRSQASCRSSTTMCPTAAAGGDRAVDEKQFHRRRREVARRMRVRAPEECLVRGSARSVAGRNRLASRLGLRDLLRRVGAASSPPSARRTPPLHRRPSYRRHVSFRPTSSRTSKARLRPVAPWWACRICKARLRWRATRSARRLPPSDFASAKARCRMLGLDTPRPSPQRALRPATRVAVRARRP